MTRLSYLLLLGFIISQPSIKPNALSNGEGQYIENTRKFIQYFRDSCFKGNTILICDRATWKNDWPCDENLNQDTMVLSKAEHHQVMSMRDHPILTAWTNDLIGNCKFISQDSIDAIFKSNHLVESWQLFHEKYGKILHVFYAPIFLRNYTLCLFYSEYRCGGLCAEGRLCLYQKAGEKWKMINTFCNWVS